MKKTKTIVRKAKTKARKNKRPSKKSLATVRDAREEIDGCDVAVTNATLDHELPASKGGVA